MFSNGGGSSIVGDDEKENILKIHLSRMAKGYHEHKFRRKLENKIDKKINTYIVDFCFYYMVQFSKNVTKMVGKFFIGA